MDAAIGGDDVDHTKLVVGQGACLIETHRVHSPESFEGAGGTHQDLALTEPARGRHLSDGGDQRQSFGYRGYRDGDATA